MRLQVLFILAGCCWAGQCLAQLNVPAVPTVGLAQVLQAARAGPDVVVSGAALAAARADITAADRAPTPQLSLKASSIDLQNGIGPGNVLRDKRIDKAVGVDWTLERGNKRELRTRVARRNAEAAELDTQEVLVQQQIAAANAFYDLLAAQERVAQVEAIAQSGTQLAGASQRRLRAGDLSQQDVHRIEIETQRAQVDLRTARADRERASLTLVQLTGLDGGLVAEPVWPGLGELPSTNPDPDGRADVLAARQRLAAAQAGLETASASRKNDLTVGASLDHFPGTSNRMLELRVQVPLAGIAGTYGYDGEIARARALIDQAQAQFDKTRRLAAGDALRLMADLRAAAARARDYSQTIAPRAREVAAMAELAYGKGAASLSDLLDSRRTLRNVLLEEIAARADHARALAAWQLRAQPSAQL